MKRSLWRSLQTGFGRRCSIGMASGLLAAFAGLTRSAGHAAAHGLGTTTHFLDTRPLGNPSPPNAPDELYARRIRPLLAKNCYGCHGKEKTSGLDLRTREAMLRGGSRGPALVPGDPEASRLYRYVAGLEKPSMPPDDRLATGGIADLKTWIAAGAPAASGS